MDNEHSNPPVCHDVTLPNRAFELIGKVRALLTKRAMSSIGPNIQVNIEICDAAIIERVLGDWVEANDDMPPGFVPLGPEIELRGPYKISMPGATDKPLPELQPLGHVGGQMLPTGQEKK